MSQTQQGVQNQLSQQPPQGAQPQVAAPQQPVAAQQPRVMQQPQQPQVAQQTVARPVVAPRREREQTIQDLSGDMGLAVGMQSVRVSSTVAAFENAQAAGLAADGDQQAGVMIEEAQEEAANQEAIAEMLRQQQVELDRIQAMGPVDPLAAEQHAIQYQLEEERNAAVINEVASLELARRLAQEQPRQAPQTRPATQAQPQPQRQPQPQPQLQPAPNANVRPAAPARNNAVVPNPGRQDFDPETESAVMRAMAESLRTSNAGVQPQAQVQPQRQPQPQPQRQPAPKRPSGNQVPTASNVRPTAQPARQASQQPGQTSMVRPGNQEVKERKEDFVPLTVQIQEITQILQILNEREVELLAELQTPANGASTSGQNGTGSTPAQGNRNRLMVAEELASIMREKANLEAQLEQLAAQLREAEAQEARFRANLSVPTATVTSSNRTPANVARTPATVATRPVVNQPPQNVNRPVQQPVASGSAGNTEQPQVRRPTATQNQALPQQGQPRTAVVAAQGQLSGQLAPTITRPAATAAVQSRPQVVSVQPQVQAQPTVVIQSQTAAQPQVVAQPQVAAQPRAAVQQQAQVIAPRPATQPSGQQRRSTTVAPNVQTTGPATQPVQQPAPQAAQQRTPAADHRPQSSGAPQNTAAVAVQPQQTAQRPATARSVQQPLVATVTQPVQQPAVTAAQPVQQPAVTATQPAQQPAVPSQPAQPAPVVKAQPARPAKQPVSNRIMRTAAPAGPRTPVARVMRTAGQPVAAAPQARTTVVHQPQVQRPQAQVQSQTQSLSAQQPQPSNQSQNSVSAGMGRALLQEAQAALLQAQNNQTQLAPTNQTQPLLEQPAQPEPAPVAEVEQVIVDAPQEQGEANQAQNTEVANPQAEPTVSALGVATEEQGAVDVPAVPAPENGVVAAAANGEAVNNNAGNASVSAQTPVQAPTMTNAQLRQLAIERQRRQQGSNATPNRAPAKTAAAPSKRIFRQ